MLKEWTGEVIKTLHVNEISQTELAEEMNCTKEYISMILNGKREPSDIQNRIEEAVASILEKRKE